ncbi:hypothetical protein [Actinacidiphila glaucinigra]
MEQHRPVHHAGLAEPNDRPLNPAARAFLAQVPGGTEPPGHG